MEREFVSIVGEAISVLRGLVMHVASRKISMYCIVSAGSFDDYCFL